MLKNRCKIEDRGLQTRERLETMIALFMMVAWRVMFLMNLRRQEGSISSAEVFEEAEWKSVCTFLNKSVPDKAPALGEFMIRIGMLGGYQKEKPSWSQSHMGRLKEAERICSYAELNTRNLVN